MSGVAAYLNDYIALGVAAGVGDQEAYDAWRDVALDPDVGVALARIALAVERLPGYVLAELDASGPGCVLLDARGKLIGLVDQQSRT